MLTPSNTKNLTRLSCWKQAALQYEKKLQVSPPGELRVCLGGLNKKTNRSTVTSHYTDTPVF